VIAAAFPGDAPPASADLIVRAAQADGLAGSADRRSAAVVRPHEPYAVGACAVAARVADAVGVPAPRGGHPRRPEAVERGGRPGRGAAPDRLQSGGRRRPGRGPRHPAYMAPELLAAAAAGRPAAGTDPTRADLFALGAVVYELLTGRHPFPPAAVRHVRRPRRRPRRPAGGRARGAGGGGGGDRRLPVRRPRGPAGVGRRGGRRPAPVRPRPARPAAAAGIRGGGDRRGRPARRAGAARRPAVQALPPPRPRLRRCGSRRPPRSFFAAATGRSGPGTIGRPSRTSPRVQPSRDYRHLAFAATVWPSTARRTRPRTWGGWPSRTG